MHFVSYSNYAITGQSGEFLSPAELKNIHAFNFKVDTCCTTSTYEKLAPSFEGLEDLPSPDRLQRLMVKLSGLQPIMFDCCVNSCCCFTGNLKDFHHCPFCRQPRFSAGHPRKQFSYLPIIPRLQHLYASEATANRLDYRALFVPSLDGFGDVFDGEHYRTLLSEFVTIMGEQQGHRFFSDSRDIALGLSTDGFCPFKRGQQTAWPFILFNYNLPPEIRFHLKNIICVGVAPGPELPKDIDSFLFPLVQELLQLEKGISAFDIRQNEPFVLHAYLLLAFGDMPAVAKLMHMKGHNGKHPCRMCNIGGIRIPNSRNTHYYIPLRRASADDSYNPTELPLRTHAQFMSDAERVANEPTQADAEDIAMETGIKGIPLLASLSSLKFPTSFPHDFMHLVWENVVKTLINLWTGKTGYLGPDEGQRYRIPPSVWDAIGEATAAASSTIPSAFGSRIPNITTRRHEFKAETYAMWTTFLGPALLEKRLNEPYYKHFVQLVRLLTICLRFELTYDDVDYLRTGFARWVEWYEK